jgi:AraC-like DNA-binding protein
MEFSFKSVTLVGVRRGQSAAERSIASRKNNLMLLKTSGETTYMIGEHVFPLKTGDIVIVPDKSDYSVKTTEAGSYIAVTFTSDAEIEHPIKAHLIGGNELFEKLIKVHSIGSHSGMLKATSILYDILYKISISNENQRHYGEASEIIDTVAKDIEEGIGNPDFRFSALYEKHKISSVYLCRLFKKYKGQTPSEYLLSLRLEKAKSLLGEGNSVSGTAYAVGFSDPLYFSKFFRKQTGYSPSEYYENFTE